jgi:hypothetical protein
VTLGVSVLARRPGMHIWTGTRVSAGGVETLDVDALCGTALDLTAIGAGLYDIYCGPVMLADTGGAPARVLLRHSLDMRHNPLDQEMTADPSAVSATKAAV